MTDYYLELAEQCLEKGNVKQACRDLENALVYVPLTPEALKRAGKVAEAVASEGDERRRKKAEALQAKLQTLEVKAERRLKEEAEAAEAARVADEERYRSAAKARLDTLHESRGTRDITTPRSFEYAVMELARDEVAEQLNKAGSLGWELVNALPGSEGRHVLYMKRDAWLASDTPGGKFTASAIPLARTAAAGAAGGSLAFAGFYYESGPDLDADGDVDGGLFDNIQNLFG